MRTEHQKAMGTFLLVVFVLWLCTVAFGYMIQFIEFLMF